MFNQPVSPACLASFLNAAAKLAPRPLPLVALLALLGDGWLTSGVTVAVVRVLELTMVNGGTLLVLAPGGRPGNTPNTIPL